MPRRLRCRRTNRQPGGASQDRATPRLTRTGIGDESAKTCKPGSSFGTTAEGTSPFAAQFQKRGPFAHDGRSLRSLDLRTRLFRNRCSYLIYSEAFNALSPAAKRYVYQRLGEILRGEDASDTFTYLPPDERAVLRRVLSDTKPDLAPYLQARKAPGDAAHLPKGKRTP